MAEEVAIAGGQVNGIEQVAPVPAIAADGSRPALGGAQKLSEQLGAAEGGAVFFLSRRNTDRARGVQVYWQPAEPRDLLVTCRGPGSKCETVVGAGLNT